MTKCNIYKRLGLVVILVESSLFVVFSDTEYNNTFVEYIDN